MIKVVDLPVAWESGYPADCKSVYGGSNPPATSIKKPNPGRGFVLCGPRSQGLAVGRLLLVSALSIWDSSVNCVDFPQIIFQNNLAASGPDIVGTHIHSLATRQHQIASQFAAARKVQIRLPPHSCIDKIDKVKILVF